MFPSIGAKPVVKWVGGKRQLLPSISALYPVGLGGAIDTYVEPFVGGGAVLFDALSRFSFKTVFVSDANTALINMYTQIRDNVDLVISVLSEFAERWSEAATREEQAELYYPCREEYNRHLRDPRLMGSWTAGAFIFLNKTCFNGLYRVNRHGAFNASLGDYKRLTICDKENLRAVSSVLQNVTIRNCSYEYIEELPIDPGRTFYFLDPPYLPLSERSGSKVYSEEMWSREDHRELALTVSRIVSSGGHVMVTQANPKCTDPDDSFMEECYEGLNITVVPAKRRISKTLDGRREVTELIITSEVA